MDNKTLLSMLQTVNLPLADGVEPDLEMPEGEDVLETDVCVPEELRRLWVLILQIEDQITNIAREATTEQSQDTTIQVSELGNVLKCVEFVFWHDLRQLLEPSLRSAQCVGIARGWRVWVQDYCNCPRCTLRRFFEAIRTLASTDDMSRLN